MISNSSLKQVQTIDDGSGFLMLLVLEHASFASTIYVVNDVAPITIAGVEYTAFPFRIKLPSDVQKESPRAQLVIDNVGRELSALLERLPFGGSITSTIKIVSRATPSITEYEFVSQLSNLFLTTSSLVCSMGPDDTMRQTSVKLRFDPTTTAGLFQG